jgi:hypothetical protein
MNHKIINGLHVIDVNGHIYVYTEKEYNHLTWWDKVKIKYF